MVNRANNVQVNFTGNTRPLQQAARRGGGIIANFSRRATQNLGTIGVVAAGAGASLAAAFSVQGAVEQERAIRKIAVQLNLTNGEAERFRTTIIGISDNLGIGLVEFQDVTREISTHGRDLEQLQKAIEAGGRALQLNLADIQDNVALFIRLNDAGLTYEQTMARISTLSRRQVETFQDIQTFSLGRAAGVEAETTLSILSGLSDATVNAPDAEALVERVYGAALDIGFRVNEQNFLQLTELLTASGQIAREDLALVQLAWEDIEARMNSATGAQERFNNRVSDYDTTPLQEFERASTRYENTLAEIQRDAIPAAVLGIDTLTQSLGGLDDTLDSIRETIEEIPIVGGTAAAAIGAAQGTAGGAAGAATNPGQLLPLAGAAAAFFFGTGGRVPGFSGGRGIARQGLGAFGQVPGISPRNIPNQGRRTTFRFPGGARNPFNRIGTRPNLTPNQQIPNPPPRNPSTGQQNPNTRRNPITGRITTGVNPTGARGTGGRSGFGGRVTNTSQVFTGQGAINFGPRQTPILPDFLDTIDQTLEINEGILRYNQSLSRLSSTYLDTWRTAEGAAESAQSRILDFNKASLETILNDTKTNFIELEELWNEFQEGFVDDSSGTSPQITPEIDPTALPRLGSDFTDFILELTQNSPPLTPRLALMPGAGVELQLQVSEAYTVSQNYLLEHLLEAGLTLDEAQAVIFQSQVQGTNQINQQWLYENLLKQGIEEDLAQAIAFGEQIRTTNQSMQQFLIENILKQGITKDDPLFIAFNQLLVDTNAAAQKLLLDRILKQGMELDLLSVVEFQAQLIHARNQAQAAIEPIVIPIVYETDPSGGRYSQLPPEQDPTSSIYPTAGPPTNTQVTVTITTDRDDLDVETEIDRANQDLGNDDFSGTLG